MESQAAEPGRPVVRGTASDVSSMPQAERGPQGINTSVPNVARIYDFLLGGKDNFAADRQAAAELIRLVPNIVMAANHNRKFLQRAVRFLAGEAGIRQFIDIGTGLPTQGSVHEIAQRYDPNSRVLYVDNDPVVIAHAQSLMADNATVVAINRDLRRPDDILRHPALRALINLDEPVAVLLVAILHFIPDNEDPYGIVDEIKNAIPRGSYLVISHATPDSVSPEVMKGIRQLYDRATAPAAPRLPADIERFFTGMNIIAPGLVDVSSWRNESMPSEPCPTIFYAGVGRKP